MKKICHRTLFNTIVYQAIPVGNEGYLLHLPCSSLDGSLDLPSNWRLHNYLLYQNAGVEGYIAYAGETTGRLSRVLEDNAGTKCGAMGWVLLFFSTGALPGSIVRNTLEARLYYALRRQPNWRFSNSPTRLSVKQPLDINHGDYIEHCVRTACTSLRRAGALGAAEAPPEWRSGEGQFEMAISPEGTAYYADAVLNARNQFEVQAGSFVQNRSRTRHDDHRPLRQRLIRQGILQVAGPLLYRFTQSYEFNHPTTAAGVVAGQNAPGMHTWRERSTGRPIGNCSPPDHLRGRWPTNRG